MIQARKKAIRSIHFFALVTFSAVLLVTACTSPFDSAISIISQEDGQGNQSSTTFSVSPSPMDETGEKVSKLNPTNDETTTFLEPSETPPAKSLEFFGFTYDKNATPNLPPEYSVNMPIWGQSLPLQPIDHKPLFIVYPIPTPEIDLGSLLSSVHCTMATVWSIECDPESPLLSFDCEELLIPPSDYSSLGSSIKVLAICAKTPEDEDEPRDTYLYRIGCAFRRDVGFILADQGKIMLIRTPAEVQALLLPIDSPEKALIYVEMITGLSATYDPGPEPGLLYFQDPVEGTHVAIEGEKFVVNMFHYMQCLCEPWINSEVYISVDANGKISWLSAVPWSMTTGWSCAD